MTPLPAERVAKLTTSLIGRLQTSAIWEPALVSATLDPIPAWVQRLDREDELYCIMTVKRATGAVTARFAMSGSTGHLLEAEAIEDSKDALPTYQDPLVIVASKKPHAAATPSQAHLIGRHPVLVWKPCRESTSRLLPFWLLTIRDSLIYVRVDGPTFTRLTTGGKG